VGIAELPVSIPIFSKCAEESCLVNAMPGGIHRDLAPGSCNDRELGSQRIPERLTKGLARHPVPIMLLARLAVDHRWQSQGVGKALLKDAMLRTLQAADIAGIRAFAVHAKDEQARRFYLKFDFIPSPSDPMHIFVLIKDVRRIVSGQ
jgi:GNAT superfamily N-acetyltransferase